MEALQKKCTCGGGTAGDLSEAIGKRCLRCCERFLGQASAWSPAAGPEPHIVTAIKLDLVEIVRLLLPIQRTFVDANGKTAADHAFELDSPDMWTLFLGEIPQDVVDVLLRAREASCVCLKKAKNLVQAADSQCLKCCYEYRSQIGKKVNDWTALMKAAIHGNLDIAKLVVRKEAKMQNEDGASALMLAAQKGNLECVKLLVEHEAKVKMKDKTTALQLAAFNGHLEIVKLLIPYEAKMQRNDGATALMVAALQGQLEVVELLVEHEAKMKKNDGATALQAAALNGRTEIVRLLASQEAKMQTKYGLTALMESARYGHLEIAKLLIPHEAKMQDNDGETALMESARNGYLEVAKLLIPHEVKMQRYDGTTALMLSAEKGHLEVAKLLIPLEAKMRDSRGKTALVHAIERNGVEAAKLLLPFEGGIADKDGKTPAEYAKDASSEIQALFAASASAPAASHSKYKQHTPEPPKPAPQACTCNSKSKNLIDAAQMGCLKCSATFIGEVGKKDWLENTALMESAEKGHLEVAKFLVDHEAGIKTNDGQTATTYAISNYQLSCLQILLANDAEREASQIPRIMLAGYDGDIRYLLANQSEWSAIHNRMAVLDFALLGGQRKAVRLLIGSDEARRSFAEQFGFRLDVWGPRALARRFLSTHASFMIDIAPAVHMMGAKQKSWLLIAVLTKQLDNVSHILRAICTPDAESMFQNLGGYHNDPQVVLVLAGLKHVGFSNGGKTVEILAKKRDGPVAQYLASNPLKQAQTRRAEKETKRRLPNEKQACWRETEAEAAFNGALVRQSRDTQREGIPSKRAVILTSSGVLREKLGVHKASIYATYRHATLRVQEILDE